MWWTRFRTHWVLYTYEALGLMTFMISACIFATLLEHPSSAIRAFFPEAWARRALMGLAMGLTAVGIIYSPWGKRSGAHINPAVTWAFYRLDKVEAPDALFYVLFQFAGAVAGVGLSALVLQGALGHPSVFYVVTKPGMAGVGVAFLAELTISAGLMLTVLLTSNHPRLQSFTGVFAGMLVASFILFEAPLSGMSMNPARTVGSAAVANAWTALWLYFVAPLLGMGLVAEAYLRLGRRAHCAKLQHDARMGRACHFKNCGERS